ncbi:MAG: hypothetical protein M5R36_22715 [Deltaproteobacteria bacterium]|nr:hypothetical protein [Deltaproteobacteria bacterium]
MVPVGFDSGGGVRPALRLLHDFHFCGTDQSRPERVTGLKYVQNRAGRKFVARFGKQDLVRVRVQHIASRRFERFNAERFQRRGELAPDRFDAVAEPGRTVPRERIARQRQSVEGRQHRLDRPGRSLVDPAAKFSIVSLPVVVELGGEAL